MATPPNAKRMRLAPKLKISPPRYLNEETLDRTELMTLEDIETVVAMEGFGDHWDDHQAVLIFLYGRKFCHDHALQKRKDKIREILNSATADRILRIAAKDGDTDLLLEKELSEQPVAFPGASPAEGIPTRTTQKNPYSLWIGSVEDWAQSYGAVTISSKFDVQLVLRRQFSTNCFIHAPGVLQGYLVQKGAKSFHGMIDLTKFIRDFAEDDLLASLVLTDNGGMSLDLLEALLPGCPKLESYRLRDPNQVKKKEKGDLLKKILESFNEHGPALISECKLDQNFLDFEQVEKNKDDPFDKYEIPCFDDYKPTSKPGTHAMVLVGFSDKGDDYSFLLQNWWSDLQFCEVTFNYLMKSKAKVTFCCTEQQGFGRGQQLSHLKFAEAKFQDRGDGYHRELEVTKGITS